jgi:hypothetical protein
MRGRAGSTKNCNVYSINSRKTYEYFLENFNAKIGREENLKPIIGNEYLHENNNDTGVGVVNSATSKNQILKSSIFPHHNINISALTSPD